MQKKQLTIYASKDVQAVIVSLHVYVKTHFAILNLINVVL